VDDQRSDATYRTKLKEKTSSLTEMLFYVAHGGYYKSIPAVLNMGPCTLKLDEKHTKHSSAAQHFCIVCAPEISSNMSRV
jgi:hypothetical protein